jgi:hypothetical protein
VRLERRSENSGKRGWFGEGGGRERRERRRRERGERRRGERKKREEEEKKGIRQTGRMVDGGTEVPKEKEGRVS